MTTARKQLIEFALPLEAINKAAAREVHPSWSPVHTTPLGEAAAWAARAVIFAQMIDIRRLCPIPGVNYNFVELPASAGELQ